MLGLLDRDHSGGLHDYARSYMFGVGEKEGACIKLSEGRDIQSNSGLKVRPGRLPGGGAVLGERTKRKKIVSW